MKVLDLRCSNDHRFEGWFGSEEDFQSQFARALVECPICADTAVSRLPSAPRLNVSKARAAAAPTRDADEAAQGRAQKQGQQQTQMQMQMQMQTQQQMQLQTQAQMQQQMQMQQHWLRALRHVLASTEDVGERFPEEARRIHYGEVEERGIRGQASDAETAALRDEGIEVVALPLPAALKGTLQ